jgi:hypothetical protein
MNLLFSIRDATIHLKPEKISPTPKEIIKMLKAKNICAEPEPKVITSWLSDISTRAVARWACNVVVDVVNAFREGFPIVKSNQASLLATEIWSSAYNYVN